MGSDGNLSPAADHSNLASWPGPPSRRACVSSTDHQRMWDECCADPVHARPLDCVLVSSCQQQDQDETPRTAMEKKKRDHHHDVPSLRARLALPWRWSKHPRTRSGARRHLDLTSNNGSRSNQGFRGTGLARHCSILQASFERRRIFSFLFAHHVSLTDQQSHGHPAGTCPWQNNALPPGKPSTSDH